MKKTKRILALVLVVLLVLLYLSTLLDAPVFTSLLKASIAATILLPVLLYGFLLFHRLSQKGQDKNEPEDPSKKA